MADLISRAYILKALGHFNDRVNGDEHFLNGIETAKEIAENAPAVDAAPVVHGKWDMLVTKQNCDRWQADAQCSQCGKVFYAIWSGFFPDVPAATARRVALEYASKKPMYKHCPNCGAKMDGGNGDGTT